MSNDTLKALLDQQAAFAERLLEAYGELTSEMEEAMAQLELNLPAKVDRCAGFLTGLHRDANVLKCYADSIMANAERFYTKASQIENFFENVKNGIRKQMELRGIEVLQGEYEQFKLQKTGKLIVESEATIPDRFYNEKTSKVLNKTSLKDALENGESFFGVSIQRTLKQDVKGRK